MGGRTKCNLLRLKSIVTGEEPIQWTVQLSCVTPYVATVTLMAAATCSTTFSVFLVVCVERLESDKRIAKDMPSPTFKALPRHLPTAVFFKLSISVDLVTKSEVSRKYVKQKRTSEAQNEKKNS